MAIIFNEDDILIPFSFKDIRVKGKILRLNKVCESVVNNFNVSQLIEQIVLETIAFNTIISSNFKFDGVFKLQVNCFDGLIKVLLVDNKSNGDIRAFVTQNKEFQTTKDQLDFKDLIGKGFLIFHLNQNIQQQPYQAIVAMDGKDITDVANGWFRDSEQIKTYIKFFSDVKSKKCGALFLQMIPNVYETFEESAKHKEDFNTLEILSNTLTQEEMFSDNLYDILYKLYNEFEVITYDKKYYQYNCSCSLEKVQDMIINFSTKDKQDLKNESGEIEVKCEFCNKSYIIR